MRIPRWGIGLLGVVSSGFVGCSQTGWLRPNGPSDMKTVASVAGKPVSTSTGEPGSGLAEREDIENPGPPPSAGARVAGRVFDDQGRAVPNARVRLVVGGSSGGRVNYATTDRSGAFTLHGLRPGRDYTLIAEYQADDGVMSGRAKVHAPETGVRITLGARDRDAEAEPRGAKILPTHVRSGLFPENPDEDFPVTARPRVREADEPADGQGPAEELAAASPRVTRATAGRPATAQPSATVRAGWMVRQTPPKSRGRSDADDTRNGPSGPDDRVRDGDGDNPLPPALEPVGSDEPKAAAPRKPRSRRDDPAPAQDDRGLATPPGPIPDEALAPASDVAPASYAKVSRRTAEDADEPSPRRTASPRRAPRSAPATAARSRDAAPANADEATEPDDAPARRRSGRRPTWRELSISPDDVPVDESLRRSSVEESDDDRDAVVRADGSSVPGVADEPAEPAMIDEPRPRRVRPPAPTPTPTPAPRPTPRPMEPVCRLDPGHRRVVELRLPGLDGASVSLADIDADLILIDFWGSWCQQCKKSIDHHREVQEQIGGRTLQVIGIACEKGATFEARRDAAIAAAGKLGINYPILVTGMDGACPVQKALQVQFYPSMLLIDREGNILQFEQGATDATLGRIDRAIARAVRDGDH